MKQPETAASSGFTLSLALVDFLPVILFCLGGALVLGRLHSALFGVGVLLCTLAGLCKSGWKLVLSLTNRDFTLLTKLFHVLLPFGFALILLSVPFTLSAWSLLFRQLLVLPSLVFLILGSTGMALMGLFAVKLDGKKASSNWIEQLTNTAAQACFVLALWLA